MAPPSSPTVAIITPHLTHNAAWSPEIIGGGSYFGMCGAKADWHRLRDGFSPKTVRGHGLSPCVGLPLKSHMPFSNRIPRPPAIMVGIADLGILNADTVKKARAEADRLLGLKM